MNKYEFFERLFKCLSQYSDEEKEAIQEYYEELINDGVEAGISESEVISKLETPEKIAESLKNEHEGSGLAEYKFQGEILEQEETCTKDNINEYVSNGEIFNIVIGSKNRKVILEASFDDKVHVYCEKNYMDEIVCYEKDGMFYFSQNNKKSIKSLFMFNNKSESVIIVKMPNTVKQAELSTTNGSIKLREISLSHYIKAETTNGSISCKTVDGNKIELSTTNGSVKCENVNTVSLYVGTTNGSIKLRDIEAAAKIKAETCNSSIKIERISAGTIELESSNGSISGVMPGSMVDYSIKSGTSHGKNLLPTNFQTDKNGLKKLSVHTSNAGIKIDFEE